MLFDNITGFLFSIVERFLDRVPEVSVSADFSIIDTFFDVICSILYFFPWSSVVGIVTIIFALQLFRITISLLKTIWAILPFV